MSLWNLKWFETGECQVVRERLDDYRKAGTMISPVRKDIYRALKETPYELCKVCIFGQDPYPNPAHATGVAFSIPAGIRRGDYPPTLVNVLKEYCDDLHYPEPDNGELLPWCRQGVLLWNTIPTCIAYNSMSHSHWSEYSYLNKEILGKLSEKGDVVFVFLGGVAKENIQYVTGEQKILTYSHPSPRANISSKSPFLGSRLFSTINDHLKEPVNWRL